MVNGRIYHHLRVKAAHQMSNKRKNKNEKEMFENLRHFRNLKEGGGSGPSLERFCPRNLVSEYFFMLNGSCIGEVWAAAWLATSPTSSPSSS